MKTHLQRMICLLSLLMIVLFCSNAIAQRIAIDVLEPAGRETIKQFPVAVGSVVPQGTLVSVPGGRLVDDKGNVIAIDAEATGWWDKEKTDPKWLLLRFNADTDRKYFFEVGGKPTAVPAGSMVKQADDQITINTGPLQASLVPKVGLIESLELNGQPMLAKRGLGTVITTNRGKAKRAAAMSDWQLSIIKDTPTRAVIDATATFRETHGADIPHDVARVTLRLEFHKGESFVRLYHTFMWLAMNPISGAGEVTISLTPTLGDNGSIQFADNWQGQWDKDAVIESRQLAADQFQIKQGNTKVAEGEHMSGSVAIASGNRGIGVSLRHAAQMYPTALGINKGKLDIQLWPRGGDAMQFTPLAIQGPEIYYHDVWKIRPWTKQEGHFVHERARFSWFPHAPQGATRTCEMTLLFHDDASKRTTEELHSATTQPIVLRQDPASAMKVPFMGFRISPRDVENYPDIERAVEKLGKYATARWQKINDHGYWRFGFMKWGKPYPVDGGKSLYRWMDGAQYDQQLIPWLLFIRGGGREWFEQAEITSRFLMDVGVRHYDERGFPTGYMSTAGGTPFPYVPYHLTKGTKVHFLTYYHHIRGYDRAREVMNTIIEGTLKSAAIPAEELPEWYYRTGGRECYNSNVLLANAYQETFDDRVKDLAVEYAKLAGIREYSEKLNTFRPPQVYMYNALVIQQRLWDIPEMRYNMMRHLRESMLGVFKTGGIADATYTIGLQWANDKEPDPRWSQLAWDIAQSQADAVPDADFDMPMPPPYVLSNNGNYRQYLLPILVGQAMAKEAGLKRGVPLVRDDLYVVSDTIHLRARQDGNLDVTAIVNSRDVSKVTLRVFDATGKEIQTPTIMPYEQETDTLEGPGYGLLKRIYPTAEFTIPSAKAGATYRLVFEGLDDRQATRVIADADCVHEVKPGNEFYVVDEAGQSTAGTRMYVVSSEETIEIDSRSPDRSPYTIRDAKTGEVLFRSKAPEENKQAIKVGKGRLLMITVGGYGPHTTRTITGVTPYIAGAASKWFTP